MLILGVDPGSSITACGFIDPTTKKTDFDFIKFKQKTSQEEKIFGVFEFLDNAIKNFKPNEVVVESPFYSVNIKSAMVLSEIKAAVIIAAKQNNLKVFQYTPRQIKQAICGYGAADKNQVRFVLEKTLNINLKDEPLDVSDALAVALTHIYTKGL
ncbi:crossover junction endodeoxyribonuclease RuvC [Hippea maritima]|uniref:Crossover junction endodeoxyribonuclease RuvC n=1 Tax=Hippea maritima (strain ATCC 700847 / DSM 10411 / MH2) TaxID=760142 RepID=F2LTL2_HIPMA|nr:crossover junction endodeoxyribonuclease RuvC [Hippea maritima]AEA33337.1 crossover junction endodeoxyribonuclease RuvC [Hippea maritima DSM 10411]